MSLLLLLWYPCLFFFFFNDTATTEIYTLSLHDALPISTQAQVLPTHTPQLFQEATAACGRSEEHTSELQSHSDLVCRLLLEKKKTESLTLADLSINNVLC